MKPTPQSIWQEYASGQDYNNMIGEDGLYATVRQNEKFYIGDQWSGLKAPDLEKPVVNIFKRVIPYYCSQIISDDITFRIEPMGHGFPAGQPTQEEAVAADNGVNEVVYKQAYPSEINRVMERIKLKPKFRSALRNAAVDGDACIYFRFDPTIPSGQPSEGEIDAELVDNLNVMFGNPYDNRVQAQPYILVIRYDYVSMVKRYAKKNGVPDSDIDAIIPDGSGTNEIGLDTSSNLVTVITRFWKDDDGNVHFCESTQNVIIREDVNMGCKLYPVAFMPWEEQKNCYHGRSPMTGLIPNQIAINRMLALAIINEKNTAFPKILYDQTKLPKGWSNRVGEAIAVTGNPNEAVANSFRAADMSAQVNQLIDSLIGLTKDSMGASDAALGNVKPENTSAIIAVQQAAAMPLERQRLSFYQFIEDCVRIILDMMRAFYGERTLYYIDANGSQRAVQIDFAAMPDSMLNLNIDIGKAAYWSELTHVQTLDNLFRAGIISDPEVYLRNVPNGYLPGKEDIITAIQAQKEQAAQQAQMAQGNTAPIL